MYYNLELNMSVCNQLQERDIIFNPDFLLALKEYFVFYKSYPLKILDWPGKIAPF
jgi:hypothetical protein